MPFLENKNKDRQPKSRIVVYSSESEESPTKTKSPQKRKPPTKPKATATVAPVIKTQRTAKLMPVQHKAAPAPKSANNRPNKFSSMYINLILDITLCHTIRNFAFTGNFLKKYVKNIIN